MSSDSEGEEQIQSWKGTSGTIILINMYDPLGTDTPLICYKATCDILKNSMRMSSSQQIGITLYGTKESNLAACGIENVQQLLPLSNCTLDDFKMFIKTDITTIEQANNFKMSDALWNCSKSFANCKKLLSTKTVILLTRMDIPPIESDQKPSLKRVVDLVDSGVNVKIINVSQNDYHIDKFYDNLLTEVHKGGEYKSPEPIWDHNQIVSLIYKHTHRNIAVARLTVEIGEGFSIGVGVYSLLQSQTKPKKVIADKETNQIVTSVTTQYKYSHENSEMDIDDEALPRDVPLLKSEILYYQMFGDKRIEFSSDEMKKLKNPFGPPMLKLLGFKPASILCKDKWFMRACQFLYPHEGAIEGSVVAFKAFYKACVEMSVIAICVLCPRINSKPSVVALSPNSQPLGLDLKLGFDVIYIPFVENVRDVPNNENEDVIIDEAHKLIVKDILTDLKFDYNSTNFENPCLQSLYNAIEALALEKDEVSETVDTTKCDPSKLQGIDAALFEELFGPFGVAASKRPASSSVNQSNSKKERTDIDVSLLEERLRLNQIQKYSVKELKDILKSKPLKLPALTGLKKNELTELVYQHFSDN